MDVSDRDYLLAIDLGLDELEGGIAQRLRLGAPERTTRRVLFADTFDWRLFARGERFALERQQRRGELVLMGADDGLGARLRAPARALPEFAARAPDAIAEPLARASADRRLFPLLRIDLECTRYPVLDDNEKTVARIGLERATARAGPGFGAATRDGARLRAKRRGQRIELPQRLVLSGLRGYGDELERLAAVVESAFEVAPAQQDRFEEALEALGIEPEPRSSGVCVELDPQMRTFDAVRRIARRLLATIEANRDGTRADLDTEFLHDLRVAVRRTRALLTQVKGVLEPRVFERFRIEFKWLGDVTGPTRDLDVLLACWPEYLASLPPEVAADLAAVSEELAERKRAAHAKLRRALASKRYRTLVGGWREFLEAPPPEWFGGPRAPLPVQAVADERIAKAFRRLIKQGSAIDEQAPEERIHALRIDGKKLRYLLEFFRSLYPGDELDRLGKDLKGLQDVLGDFNDRAVHAALLQELALAADLDQRASKKTRERVNARLLALGQLLERLRRLREKERKRFHERFAPLAEPECKQRVERLFAGRTPAAEPAPPEHPTAAGGADGAPDEASA